MKIYRVTYLCGVSNPAREYEVQVGAHNAQEAQEQVEKLAQVDQYPGTRVTKIERGDAQLVQRVETVWVKVWGEAP